MFYFHFPVHTKDGKSLCEKVRISTDIPVYSVQYRKIYSLNWWTDYIDKTTKSTEIKSRIVELDFGKNVSGFYNIKVKALSRNLNSRASVSVECISSMSNSSSSGSSTGTSGSVNNSNNNTGNSNAGNTNNFNNSGSNYTNTEGKVDIHKDKETYTNREVGNNAGSTYNNPDNTNNNSDIVDIEEISEGNVIAEHGETENNKHVTKEPVSVYDSWQDNRKDVYNEDTNYNKPPDGNTSNNSRNSEETTPAQIKVPVQTSVSGGGCKFAGGQTYAAIIILAMMIAGRKLFLRELNKFRRYEQ